jgi:hypothetical protein
MRSLSIKDSEQVHGGILFIPFIIANAPAIMAGVSTTASFVGKAAVVVSKVENWLQ